MNRPAKHPGQRNRSRLYMDTDINVILTDVNNPRCREFVERIPAKRRGIPADMKGSASFLTFHTFDYLNRAIIFFDGSYLIK